MDAHGNPLPVGDPDGPGAAGAAPGGAGGAGAAPAGAQQQAQAQHLVDALANQERIRKSTDLPLFYAQKERDTCTAELFIQRFEVAAAIARWIGPAGDNNRYERVCREFYLLLRGNALQWWKSLDNCLDFDKTNWPIVRERFLESYARQYTPTSACTGLTEMKQKPNESVQDYFVRCNVIYDRIKEIKPAALDNWRGPIPPNLHDDCLRRGKEQGVKEMGLFFLHLLFVVGLREDIRMKTIEAGDDNLEAARITAKAKELLLNDKKKVHQVFGVNENKLDSEEESSECEVEELDEEEEAMLIQVNAMRRQQGKKPYRMKKRTSFKDIVCHYCHKKGHFQKICRKRQRDGAPMVTKVNDISGKEEEDPMHTNLISLNDYYGLYALKIQETKTDHLNY